MSWAGPKCVRSSVSPAIRRRPVSDELWGCGTRSSASSPTVRCSVNFRAGSSKRCRRTTPVFVASLDRDGNGRPETYRTGFWRERSGRHGTFLAVYDPVHGDQAVITASAAADEVIRYDWDIGVFLSWHNGDLHVANCNCPRRGDVHYRDGRLTVTWTGPESFE